MPHAPFMLAESAPAENPVKLLVVLLWFVILAVGGVAKFLSAQKKSDAEEEDEPADAAPFPPADAAPFPPADAAHAPARNAVPEAPEDAFAAMLREELIRQKERARERRLEEMRARRARAEKARTEKKPVPAAQAREVAETPPAPAAQARRKTAAPAADLLGSREALRRAVLAQEILSPPLALRDR